MKQRNIIPFTHESMAELLGLNSEHEVLGVIATPQDMIAHRFQVMIAGPECTECPEGNEPCWDKEALERARIGNESNTKGPRYCSNHGGHGFQSDCYICEQT